MDKTKVSLVEEVELIYADLAVYREESKRLVKEADSEAGLKFKDWWSVAAIAITFLFILLGKKMTPQLYQDYPMLLVIFYTIALLAMIVCIVSFHLDYKWFKKEGLLGDVTLNLLREFSSSFGREVRLVESFSKYSVESLQYVAVRFRNMNDSSLSAAALILGSITKIGIIPGVVAILLAIYKMDATNSFIYDWIAFCVVGGYVGVFFALSSNVHFDRYAFLIDFHLEHIRKKEQ